MVTVKYPTPVKTVWLLLLNVSAVFGRLSLLQFNLHSIIQVSTIASSDPPLQTLMDSIVCGTNYKKFIFPGYIEKITLLVKLPSSLPS